MSLMQARRVPLLITKPYIPPPPGVTDTFTGADATNLNGRAADTGQAWVVSGGTVRLSGNQAKIAAFDPAKCVIDSGLADCTVQADVSVVGSTGLIFRYVDANNYWRLVTSGPGANYFLKRMLAGTETDIHSMLYPAGANPRTMKVVLAGSSIQVYDGATHLSALDATDSTHATATKHGFHTEGFFGSDTFYDNFSVA